jgi:hypothetical protein
MNYGWIAIGALILLVGALVIGGVACLLFIHFDDTPSSGGTMTDTVYSIEKSGLFWKRWEISFTNEHNMVYCTRDEEIAKKIKEAAKNKEKITVTFNDEMLVWDWDCSSNTIITEMV